MAGNQLEAERSKLLKAGLKKLRAYAIKIVGNTKQESGIPDILVCWEGQFIGIEVKIIATPGCKLDYSGVQKRQLERINDAEGLGVGVAWCKSTEQWGLDLFVEGHVGKECWYDLRGLLGAISLNK